MMTPVQKTNRALAQMGYNTDELYTPLDYNDLIDSMTKDEQRILKSIERSFK